MMAIIVNGGRKPFSTTPPSVEERAEAYSTLLAYAGSYTVSGDRVIHHVEAAWRQDWANTDQVRFVLKLEGNRVTLRTPVFADKRFQEVVWERLKSDVDGR